MLERNVSDAVEPGGGGGAPVSTVAAAPVTAAAEAPPAAVPPPAAPAPAAPALDPAVAALCLPLSESDPCGPDLDAAGDAAYLNYIAASEGLMPSSFFSAEDGKPFDRASVDLPRQIELMNPLWERSRDLRLLLMRAHLAILNRDLGGFSVAVTAIAEWLDKYWDAVHPQAQGGDWSLRVTALARLNTPTVRFPLQYTPLFEARRLGTVTYRWWMIASGEAKARSGEQKHTTAALLEALAEADPTMLAATRKHIATLKASLGRIRNCFLMQGSSPGLDPLSGLVDAISAFVDPHAATPEQSSAGAEVAGGEAAGAAPEGAQKSRAPATLAQAKEALAAVGGYYERFEPSSPTLPLVRQAHQLIGKSFHEVMSILIPNQLEKAAFQIGAEQFFELPVGKLSKLSEIAPVTAPTAASNGGDAAAGGAPSAAADGAPVGYRVDSRAQAIMLIEQVQKFFRHAEPSSPVPMLCDRARALAERDFMGVLRDVLPKAALKNSGADR